MSDCNWADLEKIERRIERSVVADEDLTNAIKKELTLISAAVDNIRKILFVAGLKATDDYVSMAKENAFSKEETLINPRVRLDERYKTPSFFWEKTIRHIVPLTSKASSSATRNYEAYVSVKGSKVKQKRRVYLLSKHVAINKRTLETPMASFQDEPVWAQMAAELIEPKLVRLRKLNKEVSNLNRQLLAIIKSMD